jgi:probable rRNA maturation factor
MELLIDVQVDEAFSELVNTADLQEVMAATLRRHSEELGEVVEITLRITDDVEMQALNQAYRGVDAATDVLSFAAHETGADEPPLDLPAELAAELARHWGDIVIAYPYAARQAAQFGNSIPAELRLLAIHGTLHLLGYDHAAPDEEAAMWAEQEAILTPYGDAAIARRNYPDEPNAGA